MDIDLTAAVPCLNKEVVIMELLTLHSFVAQMVDAQGDPAVGDDIVVKSARVGQ